MVAVAAKWTLEDYHRMIESGVLDHRRVELIKGEIVEMAPEGEPHAYFVSESGEYLTDLLGKRAKVRYGNPITLPNHSEPEPDIAVVQRLGKEYFRHHPYPENIFWLIEYSDSSLKKDLHLKPQVYAEVGIPEYWVVDINQQSLIVFRFPENGRYTSQTTYTEGNISPVTFPDLSVSVSAIIEQV
ncbi:MAG: Uma2 family endonuclease [Cyanobacteria bacterium J06559_1]